MMNENSQNESSEVHTDAANAQKMNYRQHNSIADFFLYPEFTITNRIFEYLDVHDLMKLAYTNKTIHKNVFELSEKMRDCRDFVDFNQLPKVLTEADLTMVHELFPKTKKIRISDDNHLILDYLSKFRDLSTLDIFVEDWCSFVKTRFRLKKLKISAMCEHSYADPIFDIIYSCDAIDSFSMNGGHLSKYSLLNLSEKLLDKITLKDVCILFEDIHRFVEAVQNSYSLVKLKFILTNEHLSLFPTMQGMLEILDSLYQTNPSIEELTFTITDYFFDFTNLRHLSKLCKMTIYFTVQYNTESLDQFIELLPDFENVKIHFIEILQFPHYTRYGDDDLEIFRGRSEEYKAIFEDMDNITFDQYSFY